MLREELSQLQQPHVSQENINSNSITSTEEVCWIGGEEPTEEQIRFLVGTGSYHSLKNSMALSNKYIPVGFNNWEDKGNFSGRFTKNFPFNRN